MECKNCKCDLDGQGFRSWPGDDNNPKGTYCFGCAPTDNIKIMHTPIEPETIDPCEQAYDEGLEARGNGYTRRDNPYSDDDLCTAWDDGWLDG